MNKLLGQIRRISGHTIAPIFQVEAIRRYAMARAVPASIPTQNYPTLEAKHLDNPKLFTNRTDLISSMRGSVKGGVIAEVGVGIGDFSEYLLNELRPKRFVGFDIFTMHEWPRLGWGPWGKEIKTSTLFNNKTHLDYYRRRFADRGAQVVIEVGPSDVNLARYPDKSFDLIYVDGDHSYEGVKKDASVAKVKLSDDGVMVFNDYKIFDHLNGVHYGVVQAVNELVVNEGWRVCGFSLEKNMFCDIAIRKQPGKSLVRQ